MTTFKTFTHMHSSFLNPTRLQNRLRGLARLGARSKRLLLQRPQRDLKAGAGPPVPRARGAPRALGEPEGRGPATPGVGSPPNFNHLQICSSWRPSAGRPELSWSGGHTSNPAKTTATAGPHIPARPRNPARRERRVSHVR